MGCMMRLDILKKSTGTCCKCGVSTEAKIIRYCRKCYDMEERSRKIETKKDHVNLLLSASGIPNKKRGTSFDDFIPTEQQKKAISLVRNQLDSYGVEQEWKMPYLYGTPGTGKTLIGLAACVDFIRSQRSSVKYIHVPDIMIDGSFYNENKASIQSSQLLVLDDIGHHNTNQYSINILYNIINYRMMNQMGVMIISNFSIESLTNKLSNDSNKINDMTCVALRDRIMAMCLPIELKEENIRVKNAIEETTKRYEYLGMI